MKIIKSFGYAATGIKEAFKSETNMKIHALLSLAVIILSLALRISLTEWIILFLTIGFVFAMEFINTSLETIVDIVSPEKQEKARIAKDVAAAGVLFSAIISVFIACLIFLPKIIRLLVP